MRHYLLAADFLNALRLGIDMKDRSKRQHPCLYNETLAL